MQLLQQMAAIQLTREVFFKHNINCTEWKFYLMIAIIIFTTISSLFHRFKWVPSLEFTTLVNVGLLICATVEWVLSDCRSRVNSCKIIFRYTLSKNLPLCLKNLTCYFLIDLKTLNHFDRNVKRWKAHHLVMTQLSSLETA